MAIFEINHIDFVYSLDNRRQNPMKTSNTRNILKLTALSLALVLLASTLLLIPAEAADTSSMGALVDTFTSNSSTFTLSSSSRFFIVAGSAPTGDLLQTVQLVQRQFAADGFPSKTVMPIVWGAESMALTGDIVIKLNASSGIAAEGYTLNVTTKAVVTASDVDGLMNGLNMLHKHFRVADATRIKGFSSGDAPDTKERTVHLDLARKYYTVEWVCNFIRQMSWMGYNALELHLSEDGGFRADFWDPAYFTSSHGNIFSWLCGSHIQSWVSDPYRTDPDAGEFLTTAELVQICNVAKEYHIEIIPSFDSPGHMDYITWKFEQNYKSKNSYSFTYNGTTYKASSTNGCINYGGVTGQSSPTTSYKAVDITEGSMARAFVFALYEDMADFFKQYAGSTKFNIGADEVTLNSTSKWSYSAFPGYINSLNRMLNSKGYTVRMYNDFIGSTTYNQSSSSTAIYSFDKNIEICYWNSDFNVVTGKRGEGVYDKLWHTAFFWHDGTTHAETSSYWPTNGWGDGGRTMYNCIQTNTYYVLREGTSGTHRDARDPNNRSWTFYHTNEDAIYNEWYPADISEKGVNSENAADIPQEHLGGAYFLIWNDYAALNTEAEVWNGALDCYDKDRYYYLFDIMAANIIKMWNADINTTTSLTAAGYQILWDDFKNLSTTESTSTTTNNAPAAFPGFTSCSAKASLPAATAPIKLISQATLKSGIGTKLSSTMYTTASYNAYSNAYDEAAAIANKTTALTAAEQNKMNSLLTTVNSTKSALVIRSFTITANHKVSGSESVVKAATTHKTAEGNNTYSIRIDNISGYAAVSATGTAYSVDSTGITLTGTATDDMTVTIYYKKTVDTSKLDAQIATGNSLNSAYYTTDSWAVYSTALANAQAVANNANATQADIDAAANALQAAYSALVTAGDPKATPLTVELLNTIVPKGKQVGIRIMSDPGVENLTITCNGATETPVFCSSQVQTLYDGDIVRCWLVFIDADTTGTFTYTINGSVDVIVTIV